MSEPLTITSPTAWTMARDTALAAGQSRSEAYAAANAATWSAFVASQSVPRATALLSALSSVTYTAVLAEMRAWLGDCWESRDWQDAEAYPDTRIVDVVEQRSDGGVIGFLRAMAL